jgi:Tol biopolymer transport system component
MGCSLRGAQARRWLLICLIAVSLGSGLSPTSAQGGTPLPPIGFALYRSEKFSLPYPNFWEVTERGTDTYFGASHTPICAEAGMIAQALGAAGDRTFEDLLNEYTRTFTRVDLAPERIAIRRTGLSAHFVAPCTDGTPRQYRVTFFIIRGQAYRLSQFAPQAAFSAWADVFGQIVNEFSPAALTESANSSPIVVPFESPLALIAHIFGGNVYVGTLADLPGKPITQGAANGRSYRSPALSPDGTLIAYIDPHQQALWLARVSDGAAWQVVSDVADGYPLAWKADGSQLAYMAQADGALKLRAVQLPDLSLRDLGETLAERAECPLTSDDPSDRLYWWETGAEGNSALMAWSGETLYYSLRCGIGVARLSAGKSSLLNADLRRAQLSPDGRALLGVLPIEGSAALVRLNLQTGALDRIEVPLPVEQMAWQPDGRGFFFASAELKATMTVSEGDPARGLALFGAFPSRVKTYALRLWEVDLGTGVLTKLFEGEGRAIGRIAPSPDGSGVLFSVVQSAQRLADAFVNNASQGELRREAPVIQLYWRPLPATEDSQAILVAISSAPAWGRLGSAPPPTPTSSPRRLNERLSATPMPTATFTPTPSPAPSARRTALPTNTPRASRAP